MNNCLADSHNNKFLACKFLVKGATTIRKQVCSPVLKNLLSPDVRRHSLVSLPRVC